MGNSIPLAAGYVSLSSALSFSHTRGVGYGPAEGMVDSASTLEATVCPHVDDDVLPLISANQSCAGQWQARVERRPQARFHRTAFVDGLRQEVLRRADAQVGVVRDLERAAARTLRESTPRIRLDTPGDTAEQELLVVGSGGLAEDLAVLVLELRGGQAAQAFDLFCDP
jgi:hypothetical protein